MEIPQDNAYTNDNTNDNTDPTDNISAAPAGPSRWQGLPTRVTGVLPLLGVVLIAVIFGGVPFSALVLVTCIYMLREWDRLVAMEADARLKTFGFPLIIIPCACLLWLRSLPEGGSLTWSLIAIIAATDIGAYFAGKRFGKRLLAPAISPGKTQEGLAGGVACAMLVTLLTLPALLKISISMALMLGLLFPVLAQGGDLFESWVKRRAGVKDSGTLIPGHGGLLDRLDGYLFTTPFFALVVYFSR